MKLIVFDVDGTLVDSQELIVAAQRATFEAHGIAPPSRERSLSIVGLSLPEAFAVLAGPEAPVESLAEGYRRAFQRLRADPALTEPLFPRAGDVLKALSRRSDVVLGIATGKSRRGVAHLVARHGWDGLFATVQTADDAPSKPDPGMLRRAVAETGIPAADTIMIGDTTFDMTMARAASVLPIGVTWGYHPANALVEAGAAVLVSSFPELFEHLLERLAPTSQNADPAPMSGA